MTVTAEPRGRLNIDGERATVTFDVHYPQSRSVVWRALTDPAQLAKWLDKAVVELHVGGAYEVQFDDGAMVGRITKLVVEELLIHTWDEGTDHESVVRWDLSDDADGTRLQLTHTRLAADSAASYGAGWHLHIEMLAAALAGSTMPWSDQRFDELVTEYTAGRG